MPDSRALVAICGTRPEAVKLAPVIHALRNNGRPVHLVDTGQHPDLAPVILQEAGLAADHVLPACRPGRSPQQQLAAIMAALDPLFRERAPPMVLVQGDTVSALAGALAASYAHVPLAHVEAGLRTGSGTDPFPEEMHRQLIGRLAALHFAPTPRAAAALLAEGVDATAIHVTGNSGIDAFHTTLRRLREDSALQQQLAARFPFAQADGPPLLLATVHRRENIGAPLSAIAQALARLAGEGVARIVVPLHPNPRVQIVLQTLLQDVPNAHTIPAVDHATMAWLMCRAQLLLTDSGGLQEEAPSLGLRTLVLRRRTEREEAIDCGASALVPLCTESIVQAARAALAQPPLVPCHPFGDGNSAARIAGVIEAWLRGGSVPGAETFHQWQEIGETGGDGRRIVHLHG